MQGVLKTSGKYLKSAVYPEDYPPGDRPEVAMVGRSNAGKSSLINRMCGSQVARTSKEPGKTVLLNFYDIGEKYRLVDMPGYGYSKRPGEVHHSWRDMIEPFLCCRKNLVCLVLIIDFRRKCTKDEMDLLEFANLIGRPMLLVLNKIDKLNVSERKKMSDSLKKATQIKNVFLVSALSQDRKKNGIEQFEDFLFTEYVATYIRDKKEMIMDLKVSK